MTDHGGAASPRTDPLSLSHMERGRDLTDAEMSEYLASRQTAVRHGTADIGTEIAEQLRDRLAAHPGAWSGWTPPWVEAAQEAPAPEGLPTILEATDWPRVRCSKCGSQLLGRGWLEHHADGSHSFYPAEARQPEGPCARHWGSDGTLCSTHNGRFASTSENRCDRAEARPPEGLGAAWAVAEAALETRAEGSQWELRLGRFTPSSTYWADGSYLEMYPESITTEGPTPAAALLALAARLSAGGATKP